MLRLNYKKDYVKQAYPDANVDKILEGSLVRCTCGTEAIYVRLAARSSNSGALDFTIFLNLNAR